MTDTLADFDLACTAAALYLYPVKACAGMPVQEIELDASGLAAGDRAWAIVDAEGAVTWQGAHPRLALVQPRIADHRLGLRAPGADEIAVPADGALTPCRVKIWSDLAARHDVFDAADAGDAVAAWLERVVGAPLRLVRLCEAARSRAGNNALHLVFSASVAAVDEFVGDTLTALSQRRRTGATVFGVYARGTAGTRLRMGDAARLVLAF